MAKRKSDVAKIIEGEIVKPVGNSVVPFSPNLPVSKASIETLDANRRVVAEFIKNQLRENVDFGVIGNTKLPSLLKPGAEKFAKLFNLVIEKELTDKVIDRHENFAMFTYRATVKHGPSGLMLAQCEGSCNSQEKKYRERKSYNDDRSYTMEPTPISDILNTLMKMAQKRAMVGAVIEAVGASDFYTQDIDDPEDAKSHGLSGGTARAKVEVPTVNAASSEQTVKSDVEICDCGNRMMISKYGDEPRPWYCGKCKATKPRE